MQNMGRMVIPAIWDVFWDQTDLLRTLVRPPTPSAKKIEFRKKKFFGLLAYFYHFSERLYRKLNKTVNKIPTSEKIENFYSRILIFASFDDNLACSI